MTGWAEENKEKGNAKIVKEGKCYNDSNNNSNNDNSNDGNDNDNDK